MNVGDVYYESAPQTYRNTKPGADWVTMPEARGVIVHILDLGNDVLVVCASEYYSEGEWHFNGQYLVNVDGEDIFDPIDPPAKDETWDKLLNDYYDNDYWGHQQEKAQWLYEWKRERAYEAGMLHGVEAYNDVMIYG